MRVRCLSRFYGVIDAIAGDRCLSQRHTNAHLVSGQLFSRLNQRKLLSHPINNLLVGTPKLSPAVQAPILFGMYMCYHTILILLSCLAASA